MYKYPWHNVDMNVENAISKLLRLVIPGRMVLEVGCATGYVSKTLKEVLNCSVTGIEVDPGAAKEAGRYCERVIVGDVESMDFSEVIGTARFDLIIFGDVLEHLMNPGKVLSNIRQFIADEGFIIASIPNIAHISVALELLEGRFDYRPLGLLDDTHIRFFTKKSILALFRNAGYEIVLWDRIVIRPEDTEFATVLDAYPHSLLSFIGYDTEALTYQFIVKAVPHSKKEDFNDLQSEFEKSAMQELMTKYRKNKVLLQEKEKRLESIPSLLSLLFRKILSLLRVGVTRG